MMSLTSVVGQLGFNRNSSATTPLSLALILSDRKISCFVWGKETSQSQIYSTVTSGDWGGQTIEELVVSADGVTSAAINQVSQKFVSPPTQVALAVPYSWVDKSGLNSEKSLLLANLTRKLGLMASGFIVVPEAIAWYLKDSLGVNSCLLLQAEENDLYLSLVRQNKVVSSAKINRSDNIAADVEEGVFRLNDNQPLPPVVYLTGNIDLIELQQKLTNYPWPDLGREDRPVFLQLPKFEACPIDFEAKAIVAQITGDMSVEEAVVVPVKENIEPIPIDLPKEDVSVAPDNVIPPPVLEPTMFGFTRNQDVNITTPIDLPKTNDQAIEQAAETSETLITPSILDSQPQIIQPVLTKENTTIPPSSNHLALADHSFFRMFGFISRVIFRKFSRKAAGLIFIPLLILVLLFILYRQVASAEVRLLVNSQKQSHKFTITLSDKINEIDKEKLILPIKSAEVELSGSGTTDVRGSKEVGDKATGEATIYNGTSMTKSLTKGTLITSSTGLKFSLNDAYVVPAKSTDLLVSPPVDKWGEKTVAVTAVNIGAAYNLAASSTFSFDKIASSSSWLIKNQNAFTNGTSRQVQAVDDSDRKRLSQEVIDNLTSQAGSKIEEETKNNQGKLLAGTIKVKSKTERFDHTVGEETETLKLEEKTVFTGQYYSSDHLFELVNNQLQSLVPAGYQQKPNYSEPVVSVLDQTKGTYEVKIDVEYVPQVDLVSLSQQLQGKRTVEAETVIKTISGVTGYESDLRPFPFSLLRRFPLRSEKIAVSLVTK